MKKKIGCVVALVCVLIGIAMIGTSMHHKHELYDEWANTRQVEKFVVYPGDTLWSIAEDYKPDWMDTREYLSELKVLNKLSDYLYDYDELLIYTDNIRTMQGYYCNGRLVTNDGNEWAYTDNITDDASVIVVFNNNNTPDDIYDDIIIDIEEV